MNRLIMVIPSLNVGGAEHLLVNQVNALNANGLDLHLVVLSDSQLREQIELPTEKIHILGLNQAYSLNRKAIFKLYFNIKQFDRTLTRINGTHVVAHLPLSHHLCRLHRVIYRRNYMLWNYHHSIQYEANPLDSTLKKLFNNFNQALAKFSDTGNIFVSNASLEDTKRNIKLKGCVVLYSGVNENARPDKSLSHEIFDPLVDKVILIPGRLHESKGQKFFIEATSDLIRRRNLQVILGGGGDELKSIENLISKLELNPKYTITGQLPNNKLLGLMSKASIIVIPSINEGLGLTAIESLRFGKLILSSDSGGLKEVIVNGKNGFIFEKSNEQDLCEKLDQLLENKLTVSQSEVISSFQKNFSFEAHIQNLTQLLIKGVHG